LNLSCRHACCLSGLSKEILFFEVHDDDSILGTFFFLRLVSEIDWNVLSISMILIYYQLVDINHTHLC